MNGIEQEINVLKYVTPVRFADDIVIVARTNEQLDAAKEVVIKFLEPRGLQINESKTKTTTIEGDGITYLGYHIKEYPDITRAVRNASPEKTGIVISKPSKESIKAFKQKIKTIVKKNSKSSPGKLIMDLNPVIRGWANYYNAGGGWSMTKNKLG